MSSDDDKPIVAPGPKDLGALREWAEYAKDRFEVVDQRVDSTRARARQLAAALTVVVGFELTILGKFAFDGNAITAYVRAGCIAALVLLVAYQLLVVHRILLVGYNPDAKTLSPESPQKLFFCLHDYDERRTQEAIGGYYANSSALYRELDDTLSAGLKQQLNAFQWSIPILVVVLALGSLGTLFSGGAASTICNVMSSTKDDAGTTEGSAPAESNSGESTPLDVNPDVVTDIQAVPTPTPGELVGRIGTPTDGESMAKGNTGDFVDVGDADSDE